MITYRRNQLVRVIRGSPNDTFELKAMRFKLKKNVSMEFKAIWIIYPGPDGINSIPKCRSSKLPQKGRPVINTHTRITGDIMLIVLDLASY